LDKGSAVTRPLPTHRTIQTQKKRTERSMPIVRFELTISMLERAKTVHALDRVATVTGTHIIIRVTKTLQLQAFSYVLPYTYRSITYIHTYIRTYVHTYIHTYIRTYVHTYVHTYIHT
jgi:hypothetical protein